MTNRTLLEVNQGMNKSRITTDWLFMNQRTKSETGWWLHSLKVKMGLISNISLVEVRLGCNNSLEWLPPCTGFLHHLASSMYRIPPSFGLLHLLASSINWPPPFVTPTKSQYRVNQEFMGLFYLPPLPMLNHSHLTVAWLHLDGLWQCWIEDY